MSNPHAFRDLREHVPHRDDSEVCVGTISAPSAEPFPGYDNLTVTRLRVAFHHRTQDELAACDDYERSHLNREAVLTKLRFMRSTQPWDGYDQMPEEEILARLESANLPTLKGVRDYERKFGNRPRIHGAALHRQHDLLAHKPSHRMPSRRRRQASQVGV